MRKGLPRLSTRGSFCASHLRLSVSACPICKDATGHRRLKCGEERSNQNRQETGRRLAGGGRRTNKESGFRPLGDSERLSLRCGSTQRNKDNSHGGHSDRRSGVHDDTDRALVRICLAGMKMGYLDEGKKRQQRNAQERHRRTETGAGAAAFASKFCSKAHQDTNPCLLRIPYRWTPRFQ